MIICNLQPPRYVERGCVGSVPIDVGSIISQRASGGEVERFSVSTMLLRRRTNFESAVEDVTSYRMGVVQDRVGQSKAQ